MWTHLLVLVHPENLSARFRFGLYRCVHIRTHITRIMQMRVYIYTHMITRIAQSVQWLGCILDDQGMGGQFLALEGELPLLDWVETGRVSHPISYQTNKGDYFPCGKKRAWRWPPTPHQVQTLIMMELYTHSPIHPHGVVLNEARGKRCPQFYGGCSISFGPYFSSVKNCQKRVKFCAHYFLTFPLR